MTPTVWTITVEDPGIPHCKALVDQYAANIGAYYTTTVTETPLLDEPTDEEE